MKEQLSALNLRNYFDLTILYNMHKEQ